MGLSDFIRQIWWCVDVSVDSNQDIVPPPSYHQKHIPGHGPSWPWLDAPQEVPALITIHMMLFLIRNSIIAREIVPYIGVQYTVCGNVWHSYEFVPEYLIEKKNNKKNTTASDILLKSVRDHAMRAFNYKYVTTTVVHIICMNALMR